MHLYDQRDHQHACEQKPKVQYDDAEKPCFRPGDALGTALALRASGAAAAAAVLPIQAEPPLWGRGAVDAGSLPAGTLMLAPPSPLQGSLQSFSGGQFSHDEASISSTADAFAAGLTDRTPANGMCRISVQEWKQCAPSGTLTSLPLWRTVTAGSMPMRLR